MKASAFFITALISCSVFASQTPKGDYLVKMANETKSVTINTLTARLPKGTKVQDLNVAGWVHVKLSDAAVAAKNGSLVSEAKETILRQPGVLAIQPNYRIKLLEDFRIKDPAQRAKLLKDTALRAQAAGDVPPDNPAIPRNGSGGSGNDPEFSNQWGMNQIGVKEGWKMTKGTPDVVVAVIDTGVDYTHEDLVDNLWRNPGEMGTDANGKDKSTNGIDDDGNGYKDDVIGWDFASKDNKPFDLPVSIWDMLTSGGNPGHGTHCAGNVAARSDNGKGIAGVAPNIKIMSLRFITEKGQGTTADAISAIKYATAMGAKVTSNSWGSEGEEAGDPENQALRDVIQDAQNNGVLFIAAAGNGHNGNGYNNDTDSKPGYPASYDHDIIISVAALDEAGALGSFSNWGARTVDLGAPGVKVFSTMVSNKYSDKVIDFAGMTVYWDGTSMATPHVAGAAALYWSAHPEKTWQQVKSAILTSVKRTNTMNGKSTSGGALDVGNLMRM